MTVKSNLKLVSVVFACTLLVACGGDGGTMGGFTLFPDGKGPEDNRRPVVTSVVLVDNDTNLETPIPEELTAVRVTADRQVGDSPLVITVDLIVGNDPEVSVIVKIPAGEKEVLATLSELDIDLSDHTGVVEIALSVKESSDNSYAVKLLDGLPRSYSVQPDLGDDPPSISVSAIGSMIIEGGGAGKVTFNFTTSRRSYEDLTIYFMVEESGNMIDSSEEGIKFVTLMANQEKVNHEIPVVDDRVDKNDSRVTVTLIDSANVSELTTGTYRVSGNGLQESVDIIDNDVPVISIVGGTDVTEGPNGDVLFTVSSDIERDSRNLTIGYRVDTGFSDFLASMSKNNGKVILPEGGLSVTAFIHLAIVDDRVDENDGTVRVNLLQDMAVKATYALAVGEGDSASVNVFDDDVPSISISDGIEVIEGPNANAQFIVSSDIERKKRDLTIAYSVDTGFSNILAPYSLGYGEVLLPSGSRAITASIHLAIIDDRVDENDGTVRVKLLRDTRSSATYTVSHRDTATAIVLDDDIPEISIVKQFLEVTEGNPGDSPVSAEFVVSANLERANGRDLTIFYDVESEGDFFDRSDVGTGNSLILHSGAVSVTASISIPVLNDREDEASGSVSVSLREDIYGYARYILTNVFGISETINVLDDDIPEISIAAPIGHDGILGESESLDLVLMADPAPYSTITVNATLSASIHFASSTITGTIAGNQGTGTLTIDPDDNSIVDGDNSVSITLSYGTGYVPAPQAAKTLDEDRTDRITLMLVDDDLPKISIMSSNSVTEGSASQVEFIVSSDLDRNVTMDVNYTITANDFIDSTETLVDKVSLPAGKGGTDLDSVTATIPVLIISDDSDSDDEVIEVTITENTVGIPYTIATPANANVMVTDDEEDSPHTEDGDESVLQVAIQISPEHNLESENPVAIESHSPATEIKRKLNKPKVSIIAEMDNVEEGQTAVFKITSEGNVSVDTYVFIEVDQGNRNLIDEIANEIPLSVTIEANTSSSILRFPTINDNLETENGKIKVTISENDQRYEVIWNEAVIEVIDIENELKIARYDSANNSIMPDLLVTIGNSLVGTVASNVESANKNRYSNKGFFNLAGHGSIQDVLQYKMQELNDNNVSWADLLEDTSFRMPVVSGSDSNSTFSVWGSVDHTIVSEIGENDGVPRNGDFYIAHLGFDTIYQNGLLAGASTNFIESDVEYTNIIGNGPQKGNHRIQLNGVHPYFGWASQDRTLEFWSSAGYGQGRIEIGEIDENTERLDASLYILSIGSNSQIFTSNEKIFGGKSEFRLRAGAWTSNMHLNNGIRDVNDADYAMHRISFATETSNSITLKSEETIGIDSSAGMRWDGGSIEQGLGIDLATDVSYKSPIGIGFESGGRILMRQFDGVSEWGLQGDIRFDRSMDNSGALIYLSPSWGKNFQGSERKLSQTGVFDDIKDYGSHTARAELDTEISYGYQIYNETGIITLFSGINFREGGEHKFKLGALLSFGANFNLKLEGAINPPKNSELESEISSQGSIRW